MRLTKADITGAGTSVLLLAGCALLFVVVGGLLVFSEWSRPAVSRGPGDLTARAPGEGGAPRKGSAGPSASRAPGGSAPPSARRPGARPRTPAVAPLDRVRRQTPPGPGNLRSRPRVPPRPPASPSPSVPQPQLAPARPTKPVADLGPVLRRVTEGLAETTEGLTDGTDGTGETVGGVSPQLGQTVTGTGQTVSDLLRGVGARR